MTEYTADQEVAQGSAFVPFEGATNRDSVPVTKVDACAPFLLTFDPQRWTVMGGKVIPLFGRLPLISGINGTTANIDRMTGREVSINSGMARAAAQDLGHKIIPVDAIPDAHAIAHGQDPARKSYLWQPKGRPDVTLLIYTKVFPGDTAIECDEPAYLEWIQWLQDTGHIPAPPAHILRRMHAQLQARADELADKARTSPSLVPHVERAQADMKAIEAAIETITQSRRVPAAAEAGGFVPDLDPEKRPTAAKGAR